MKPILKIQAVEKNYKLGSTTIQALRGVSLTIHSGEFLALLGASGSGKSTLLNLIGGIDFPDVGEICFGERNLKKMNDQELSEFRNRELGFIFQSYHLIPVLTVFENVEFPLLLRRDLQARERRTRIIKALEEVGLESHQNHRPDQLSGGQRQRVAVARALVTGAQVILADEPTANLDSTTAGQLIDLMLELNQKKGVTFIFSTHDERLIQRVHRRLHLRDGVLQEGKDAQSISENRL
jgi:putative ABC transport system ATP-binding protein